MDAIKGSPLLTTEQLFEATGHKQLGALKRTLSEQGIRYFYGKSGHIWTTIDLVNAAAGLLSGDGSNQADAYDPNEVL